MKLVITAYPHTTCSRYRDSLWEGRSGDRIQVEARFSAPFQTGHGAHPASYTMGTWFFRGLMGLRRGIDHSSHLQPKLKKEYSCTSTPPLGLHGLFFTLLHTTKVLVPLIRCNSLLKCKGSSNASSSTEVTDTKSFFTVFHNLMLFYLKHKHALTGETTPTQSCCS